MDQKVEEQIIAPLQNSLKFANKSLQQFYNLLLPDFVKKLEDVLAERS